MWIHGTNQIHNSLLASIVVYFIVWAPKEPMGNVTFLPRIKKTQSRMQDVSIDIPNILDIVWIRKRFTGSQSNSTWQIAISNMSTSWKWPLEPSLIKQKHQRYRGDRLLNEKVYTTLPRIPQPQYIRKGSIVLLEILFGHFVPDMT